MTGSQQLRLFGVEHTAYQWVSAGGGILAGVFHVFLRPQVPGAPDECSLTFHTPLLCLAGFQFVSGGSCSRWANALDTCFLGAWRAAGCNMLSAFLWDGNGQPSELELWITHSKENRSRKSIQSHYWKWNGALGAEKTEQSFWCSGTAKINCALSPPWTVNFQCALQGRDFGLLILL